MEENTKKVTESEEVEIDESLLEDEETLKEIEQEESDIEVPPFEWNEGENPQQHEQRRWVDGPLLGRLSGWLLGLASFVSNVIGITIRNLLMSGNERMSYDRVLEEARRTADQKKQYKENRKKNAEEKSSEKEQETAKEKTEQSQDGKKEVAKSDNNRQQSSQNKGEPAKQKRQVFTQKEKDMVAKAVLTDKTIQDAFKKLGLTLQEGEKNAIIVKDAFKHTGEIKKDIFLTKDVRFLTNALIKFTRSDNMQMNHIAKDISKLTDACTALTVSALVQCRMGDVADKPDQTVCAATWNDHTRLGPIKVELWSNPEKEGTLKLLINNAEKHIVSIEDMQKDPVLLRNKISEVLHEEYKELSNKPFELVSKNLDPACKGESNTLHCKTSDSGKTEISLIDKNGNVQHLTSLSIIAKSDIDTIAQALNQAGYQMSLDGKVVSNQAVAYVLAYKENCDLKDGRYNEGNILTPRWKQGEFILEQADISCVDGSYNVNYEQTQQIASLTNLQDSENFKNAVLSIDASLEIIEKVTPQQELPEPEKPNEPVVHEEETTLKEEDVKISQTEPAPEQPLREDDFLSQAEKDALLDGEEIESLQEEQPLSMEDLEHVEAMLR